MTDKKKPKKKIKDQLEEALTGWKRALADYDNLKKDLVREKDQMRKHEREDLVQQIIPVLDNFDQALKFQPKGLSNEMKNWLQGIMHIRTQIEDVLKGIGVTTFGQEGEVFDPNKHEANSEETDKTKEDQIILKVNKRGWVLGEKIIRPANVTVNNITKK